MPYKSREDSDARHPEARASPSDLLKNWAKAADCMQRDFVQISRRRACPEAARVAPDRLACCLLKWREQV
jgi:hypothetical protein